MVITCDSRLPLDEWDNYYDDCEAELQFKKAANTTTTPLCAADPETEAMTTSIRCRCSL